jgi:membrane protein DedA with SNARE-associated domain
LSIKDSAERLLTLEEKFKKWGIYVVFVGRHFLGIRAQIFLAAGVMRMSTLKFIMADAASAILTMTLMVGIGFLGGNSIEILQKDLKRIEHIGILILAILVTSWMIYKYFRNRKV